MRIIQAAEEANIRQKSYLVKKVKNYFKDQLREKTFAIWGLAFKPNTDDMREAPSITIIKELIQAEAKVSAFDPVAHETAQKELPSDVKFCDSAYKALEGADALLLVTEWNEFRNPDFDKIKKLLKTPVVFDGRNIYEPTRMRTEGFTYFGIGRS
jgi:UDPglucose 6-dehydrogenase